MEIAEVLREMKVLYVEDEEDTREELARFLKRRVGKLVTAASGREGLERFLLHRPDLVITDLRMPEMSGLAMLAEIRKQDASCPVIIISALSDAETILEAVETGIVKYVVKPVDPSELQQALEKTAAEVLRSRQRTALPMISAWLPLDRETKLETEAKLKSTYAHVLKTLTGKGPREIHVHISSQCIEMTAIGVLTPMENSLMASRRNQALVAYARNLLYTEHTGMLTAAFEKVVEVPLVLASAEVSVEKNRDKIIFNFGTNSQ